jgi:CRISPR-associated protein Csm1
MLDYFFSAYLPALIKKQYQDSIYTIYSGGDDFCLIGAYEKVIAFANELNAKFNEFCAKNPDIHFSAAINLVHPKSPIRFAILDTEEKLGEAKNPKLKKDNLYLFETIAKWRKIPILMKFAKQIDDWLGKDTGITTQFLYRLLAYHEMYLHTQGEKATVQDYMYDALLHYNIKRNIEKPKHNDRLSELEINQLRTISTIDGESILPYLRIPVCYELYKHRK